MSVSLHLGDCLDIMGGIPDGSIDLVLADLPYGTTACKWDVIIPFEPLWAHYRRLLKPRGAVVLTASQPFTSMLVMSNPKWFRYDLIWDQRCQSGFLNAKKAPMRRHQHVLVFARTSTVYNPQMIERSESELKTLTRQPYTNGDAGSQVYRPYLRKIHAGRDNCRKKSPSSIIPITSREKREVRGLHPTQKPVGLMEYLIRTYSNEGDTVLDNTMGSGTTVVAAVNTGRNAIGIEKDPGYFAVAEKRASEARNAMPLLTA